MDAIVVHKAVIHTILFCMNKIYCNGNYIHTIPTPLLLQSGKIQKECLYNGCDIDNFTDFV